MKDADYLRMQVKVIEIAHKVAALATPEFGTDPDVSQRLLAIADRHDKLVALLRQQEWGYHQTCPYCGGDKIETGHMDNCPLATLLKEEKL
ncbi:MAG: hypothetical protein GY832_11510 [Chloroflexi bacterium]|nr:hypothetical protein [Chloroflexota bacterium]